MLSGDTIVRHPYYADIPLVTMTPDIPVDMVTSWT